MLEVDYLWTEDELLPHEVEQLFPESTISFIILSPNIDQTLSNFIKYMQPWIEQYPWNYSQPEFQAHTTKNIEYIYGELNYHDHSLDMELFIAILMSFTKYEDCFIHLFDSLEIEPILVICHEELSDDLDDVTTTRNRVWLHEDSCVILNRNAADFNNFLPLQNAALQIFKGDYTKSNSLTETLKEKCSIDVGLSHVHDIILNLPLPIAKLVSANPNITARSLKGLENEEEVKPMEFNEGIEVTTPMNSLNLGVMMGIALASGSKDYLSGIFLSGLQKYYESKPEPKIPDNISHSSRYILQDELINRGILEKRVPEDTEFVELISNISAPKMEDEEKYAKNLQNLFETNNFEEIVDPMEDDLDDEESDFSDDELNGFRWKYHDLTSEWISKEKVVSKYQEFKHSIISLTNKFKDEFKNTEFEDFPEFMESEIILEMNQRDGGQIYNDDSDYKSDTPEQFQGDMAFDDYLKFKKKLGQEKANFSDEEDEDAEWEDVDDVDNTDDDDDDDAYDNDIMSDGEDSYGEPYENKPKIEELGEEVNVLDTRLTKDDVDRLAKNLKTLKTSEDKSLESQMKKK
ncbi:hypothetical protein KGF54_004919 [Candida jiufengensis]|uniref:uncharacterized protein n=1 Tax=Candida jiufengensis TaxID=497108 RepID=UPI0022250BE4|nr:uncharacterized protein KGF54_004919 [Candida jiufengensis]KAI5951844.1 hypothetical protein KGF54_004919 [Candida jiufengensis]